MKNILPAAWRRPAAAAALAALLGAPARAARPLTPQAPEFPPQTTWINAKPLTLARLRGRRVVLAAFLNSANINSIRALRALSAWHERYQFEGLLVLGVHTPEYDWQKDPLSVRAAVKRLGVRFPVMLDNDRTCWKGFNNEGWPAFYLIDRKGRVIFDRLGEGGYAEFESEIRTALADLGYRPPAAEAVKDPPAAECGEMTATVGLGLRRDRTINLEQAPPSRLLLSVRDGETATAGAWDGEPYSLRLARDNPDSSAFLRLIYRGAQAFAVLAPPPGKAAFYVRQDDMWLHPGNGGGDVRFDDDGRSFVSADGPRLYQLVRNSSDAMHELVLIPKRKGSAVYEFSFADRCLKNR
ncbi:MAG: redoxin domain-containing protein [Elusimicrobia bacterium]|nr:redoxin domain-containing protein [Elusimicrobiota bacterium]